MQATKGVPHCELRLRLPTSVYSKHICTASVRCSAYEMIIQFKPEKYVQTDDCYSLLVTYQ